jgi:pimeloyl-ACP methyl ester carboxylesterase
MGQRLRARLLGKLVTSATGRRLAGRYLATHIEPVWTSPPEPAELVGDIEMPMLFVHGAADRFVPSSQAEMLHNAANGRSRLCVIDAYGHAEAGFDARVVDRIDREIALFPLG